MSHLLESIEDGVATLTMNRPEARNAMNAEIIEGLREALPRLGADNDVRSIRCFKGSSCPYSVPCSFVLMMP